jgi:hypothetical protein
LKGEILIYQEALFIGEYKRHKKKPGNGHLSPQGPHWRTWRRVNLLGTLRDSKRVLNKCSVSLYGRSVRGT